MERTGKCVRVPLALLSALVAGLIVLMCLRAWAHEKPKKPGKKPPAKTSAEGEAKQDKKKKDVAGPKDAEIKKKEADKGPKKGTGNDKEQEADTDSQKKDQPPKFTREQIERAYPVGERLTYNVSYKGIHAGTAVLEVNDKVRYKGRQCFRIRSYAKSAGLISTLYTVDDRFQTYVDAQTLEPLRSDKRTREGSHKTDQYIIFSPSDRTAKYYKKKRGKFVLRKAHADVPYGIQDALSSLYYLRTMKLECEKTYSFFMLTGRCITKGAFTVTKRKKLRISGVGKFMAFRLSPAYIELPGQGKLKPGEGLFVASGDSDVWVDEATGIPLRMYVKIPVMGSIKVELSKKEVVEKKKKKGGK